jgi:hypothetical protein
MRVQADRSSELAGTGRIRKTDRGACRRDARPTAHEKHIKKKQLTEKGFLGAETEQELDTSRERYEEKIQGA